MRSILAGIETEYGLLVEGRGAEDQIEDSMALVRGYPDECFVGWDYRFESPRADLRGFTLDRLAYDPEDVKFDAGKQRGPDQDVRSDRILPNGARFYNDHGHPEYATPECRSLDELVLHDKAGELAVLRAARAMAEREGLDVRVYKNNTDFHGASYGTHESYLVPRPFGFDRLFAAVTPMLIVRQILCGAGKVGAENERACTYQLSQRADFFTEPANAETLYRRPVFNTRDEPHADPRDWIRLHVIAGDANMIGSCTRRKVGLVKMALQLMMLGEAPIWHIERPVEAFQRISRDETARFEVRLVGNNWTNAYEIVESYLSAAERFIEDADLALIADCRILMQDIQCGGPLARRHIDWAAKRSMLETYMESEGTDWRDSGLRSFDLEYHNVDPEEGLMHALQQMGEVEPEPEEALLREKLLRSDEGTRALARGIAVQRFKDKLVSACWAMLTFEIEGEKVDVPLAPEAVYPVQLSEAADVGTFIEMLRGVAP